MKRTWAVVVMAVTLACGAANTEQASIPSGEVVVEPRIDAADAAVTIEAPTNQPDAGQPPSPEATQDVTTTWDGDADHAVPGANVTMTVSFAAVRKHPDADKLAAVLNATPQWSIAPGALEPVRDLEWVTVTGPSLVATGLDDTLFQHSVADDKVDKAITHDLKGRPLALQVRGVRASTATIRQEQCAVLHAPPHLIAIVPRVRADSVARQMIAHAIASPVFHLGEAMRVRALHPGTAVLGIPADISEMRLWIDVHPSDGGADIRVEGDCPTSDAARVDADAIASLIRQQNTFAVRFMTEGLFNVVTVTSVGSKVRVHIPATQKQIEAVLRLLANRLNVTLP